MHQDDQRLGGLVNPREFCRLPGYSKALFLTYDFDPVFFERVVLRELWSGGTGDILVVADSSRIEASLERWGASLIHLGRRYQLVRAAVDGTFHPKVIFRAGENGAVVWIGTGNLTFGGWGGNREMSTAWCLGDADAAWVRGLMEQIDVWCFGSADHDVPQRIRNLSSMKSLLAAWVPETGSVLLSRPGNPLSNQVARWWNGRRFSEVKILTGSTDYDGAFLHWLHDVFGVERAWVVVDPGSSSFDPARLAQLPVEVKTLDTGLATPLHAKLFWLTGQDGSAVIMGSANCSRSAWLKDPANGGNTEAVALYEETPQALVDQIAVLFDEARAFVTQSPKANAANSSAPRVHYPVAEVTWGSRDCELRIRFSRLVPPTSKVKVKIDREVVECQPVRRARTMRLAILPLEESARTRFATVMTTLENGNEEEIQRHWVNDQEALIHAAHGRQIQDVIEGLRQQPVPPEQLRIVRELQRIGAVLLTETEIFPDPIVRSGSRQEKDQPGPDAEVKPVDPDALIQSLTYIPEKHLPHYSGGLIGFSLFGVMRALFPEHAETPDGAAKTSGASPEKGQGPREPPEHAISEAVQKRLKLQMEKFIEKFRDPSFAEKCSARQLVQAAAYPLAVGIVGIQGGWVSTDNAVSWARRVFDTLFQQVSAQSTEYVGVLSLVEARFRHDGKDAVFRRVVGDGTLWLTLLRSLSQGAWVGDRAAFERALALRSVLNAQILRSSTDNERIAKLLSRTGRESEEFMVEARQVSRELGRFEQALKSNWEQLLLSQEEAELTHEPEDLLWTPNAGWAIAQETATMREGEKLKVYLQLRAKVVEVVATGFYVNVTKSENFGKVLESLVASVDRKY